MRKAAAALTFAAVLILASVTGAMATSVVTDTTWSWSCIAICATSNPTSTAVAPVPGAWAIPTTGTWISSTNSGTSPSTIALNTQVEFSSPVLHFGSGSVLTFRVWADDTAEVRLDGSLLTGSAFNTTLDSRCAAGPVGCEATEFGTFSVFATGDHTLNLRVLQLVDASPFGGLVEGDLSAVPEPATILLLGSALAAAGVVSRKRFRKTDS